jgi:ribonuclease P protein component
MNGRYLVVYFLHNQIDKQRFGFCVGRKLGSAVKRNRVKRLLREVVRKGYSHKDSGLDIVIVARKPILKARYQDIISDYENILLKTGIINE